MAQIPMAAADKCDHYYNKIFSLSTLKGKKRGEKKRFSNHISTGGQGTTGFPSKYDWVRSI